MPLTVDFFGFGGLGVDVEGVAVPSLVVEPGATEEVFFFFFGGWPSVEG